MATTSTLLLVGSRSATANTWHAVVLNQAAQDQAAAFKTYEISIFSPTFSSPCLPPPFPCFSFLKEPVGFFLSCLLGPKPLSCHICKLCSAMQSTTSASYCCYFSRKLRLSLSVPVSGSKVIPCVTSLMRKWEEVTTEAMLASLLPDGSIVCHAITKHTSLTQLTALNTSVDSARGAALLRLHLGDTSGALVNISPGSHQSLSSKKQGGVWLFGPHGGGHEGW